MAAPPSLIHSLLLRLFQPPYLSHPVSVLGGRFKVAGRVVQGGWAGGWFWVIQQYNIGMHSSEKGRPFEYSSVVMGSKDVPNVSFTHKRVPSTANSKGFSKKSDYINNKYKNKSSKVRTRNERPDIFLQGEQLSKINNYWQNGIDFRYFQSLKDKMRKKIPSSFDKHHPTPLDKHTQNQLPTRTPEVLRINPNRTELDQEAGLSRTSQFKHNRHTTNSLFKEQHQRGNARVYSTDRQRTAGEKESPCIKKEFKLRIEQKIMQKTQLQRQESEKVGEQLRRKQLFYITQKDLSNIRSESFIVVEYPSLQIITGYYYKKIVQIASLTKIVTFYAVVQLMLRHNLIPEHITVKIDDKSADMSGTSAELYQGDTYTVKQLLYALMLPSGNDAAVALARWGGVLLGEGPKDFVTFMNRLAAQIGMKFSTFGNPHGLPHPQNGSTAEDLSILVAKCLQYDIFRQVINCKQFRCWTSNEGVKRQVVWQNTNKLLRRPGFAGVKTGVTVAAGPCLASLFTAKNRQFVVILLRTNKLSRRFKQTRWILSMCLKRMNFDGSFSLALRELVREDAQLDSDNSEQEQAFNFQRNDTFELQRRRKILLNQL